MAGWKRALGGFLRGSRFASGLYNRDCSGSCLFLGEIHWLKLLS
jgi:hypothetical protein